MGNKEITLLQVEEVKFLFLMCIFVLGDIPLISKEGTGSVMDIFPYIKYLLEKLRIA